VLGISHLAVHGDGTIDSISGTIHIHPALSEVVARAAGA